VDPSAWFFRAHFYQDPVWPGSLGLESFLQLVKVAAAKRWGAPRHAEFDTILPGRDHQWTYRGQVVPTNRKVVVQAWITSVDDDAKIITAAGYLIADGVPIYSMENFAIQLHA
jgi:3-hydroxymyristoyl/3-hydroxydecanoyl-(acyl carrier protein) dehydratase